MDTWKIAALQEQEGLLKAVENTDICMFWYYPKEKLIRMSERTARMYGCRPLRKLFMRCTAKSTQGRRRRRLLLAVLTGRIGVL